MESRRTFLKKASLLAGATAAFQLLPPSIQRALAIDSAAGSTYLDAEHIVFLMQENRSFDHCYGTLRGVRGFNDPRAMTLPNGLPVWIQSNKKGENFAPFHLDIENTKATWMGSLPHGWKDMVAARNDGKMDTWLEAKKAGNAAYEHMPLTMGYYDRRDIPFYYAFADAFTVCDQHFCSSLTGTSANRSYFWAGAIREQPHDPASTAHVDNGQINYKDVGWTTYPERLEQARIDWKVYQNELSIPVGLDSEQEDWLANFTDNNLEFYKQYAVRYHPAHYTYMEQERIRVQALLDNSANQDAEKRVKWAATLKKLERDLILYSKANFDKLDTHTQQIHRRAFVTNTGDPNYHSLETITYTDQEGEKSVDVPKGDIFHQFRKDVNEGNLPTVSWLVAPCRFSDHPGSPWYGAWYVSEALDILTANPEVWKKTIFILTYDENDGYFDHIAPFVPAHSLRPESGALPKGMDTAAEYVTKEQEILRTGNPDSTLDSPIGLGFRVPMVIASPWTKGGWVNSEVFDHTSTLQFLEHFIAKKFNKEVLESNISPWRRLICGDLTSNFRTAGGERHTPLEVVDRNAYVERIFSGSTKGLPGNYKNLDPAVVKRIKASGEWASFVPQQEEGTKPACALPYDAEVNVQLDSKQQEIQVQFNVHQLAIGSKQGGMPFTAIAGSGYTGDRTTWNFAARAGEPLSFNWKLANFETANYHLTIQGPNGFYRSFRGSKLARDLGAVSVQRKPGSETLSIRVVGEKNAWTLRDLSYGLGDIRMPGNRSTAFEINLKSSKGWYDLEFRHAADPDLRYHFAGHVEIGEASITDPLMGLGKGKIG